jgi:hypothetical protein
MRRFAKTLSMLGLVAVIVVGLANAGAQQSVGADRSAGQCQTFFSPADQYGTAIMVACDQRILDYYDRHGYIDPGPWQLRIDIAGKRGSTQPPADLHVYYKGVAGLSEGTITSDLATAPIVNVSSIEFDGSSFEANFGPVNIAPKQRVRLRRDGNESWRLVDQAGATLATVKPTFQPPPVPAPRDLTVKKSGRKTTITWTAAPVPAGVKFFVLNDPSKHALIVQGTDRRPFATIRPNSSGTYKFETSRPLYRFVQITAGRVSGGDISLSRVRRVPGRVKKLPRPPKRDRAHKYLECIQRARGTEEIKECAKLLRPASPAR